MSDKKSTIDRKAVFGWALYDWANSTFATTIMAGFLPIFFVEYYCDGMSGVDSQRKWAVANSIAGIVVAVLAPVLGAIADNGSCRKKFLAFFAYMGAVMTMGLYFVSQGQWLLAAGLYVFGVIGFCGANVFYDALLTCVAGEDRMDFVSALGYSLGYLGGALLFSVNVWMYMKPETFGFADGAEAIKAAFLTVGIWWAVFSVPVLLFVKEPVSERAATSGNMVIAGFKQLAGTFKKVRASKTIFLFLAAYWLYIDGVDTIIRMAVIYGKTLEIDNTVLIKALLVTNFVGFPAAIVFGLIGSRIGAKKAIFAGLAVYLFVTMWGVFISQERDFYILAVVIGLVQGGVQAMSRSFFAKLIPVDQSAEFFGFYNMMGKFATVLGPILMYGVMVLAAKAGYSEDVQTRASIASIAILFIAGGGLLWRVKET